VKFSRANRRAARELAVQAMFGHEFTGEPTAVDLDDFWPEDRSNDEVRAYVTQLVRGVVAHLRDIDARMNDALAQWDPKRVGRVERAVLRIALYEMLYEPDVPAPVAINEAIEVAKAFGSDDSPRFINGVLDRAHKKREAEPHPNSV